MRVLVAAGGTGGHINPAIAIVNEIKKRNPKAIFLFVGCRDRMEASLVTKAGFEIKFIEAEGYNRKNILTNFKTAFVVMKAINSAKKIIKEFKPDIVIGTGGYVSAPTVMAAQKLKIKNVLHEQNAFIGMSTRMLSKKADIVFLSFSKNANKIETKGKIIISGNPVRNEFCEIPKEKAREKLGLDNRPIVYSSGGSLGALKINEAMLELIEILHKNNDLNIIHSTGTRFFEDFIKKIKEQKIEIKDNIRISEYVFDVPLIMSATDIIVARSGAITLAELALKGLPSILIPSPNVTDNHQYYNAKAFADAGAAILINEEDLNGKLLYKTISEIINDKNKLKEMGNNALKLAKPNALKEIVDNIELLLKV